MSTLSVSSVENNGDPVEFPDGITANGLPVGPAVAAEFSHSTTYDADTLGAKAKQIVSPTDAPYNGVGDGVTSDQAAIAAALTVSPSELFLPDNLKFLVTSLANNLGVDLGGAGAIVKSIIGGFQKLNSYSDRNKYVFGTEYMAAFHNLMIAQSTTPTRKPIMVFSGDSTTAGSAVDADYQIAELLKNAGEARGLQTPFGLSSINRGQSGQMTAQWVTTHLAGDLAASPDLLVLRWGINDPGYLKDGTTPALDAGQSFPNRRDKADFANSLRAGLTTIRAARSVSSLSIVLMTPNSTSDTPNGRDELWYESITPIIKQAARDFNCVFIDTYAFLRDSRPAAGVWMDDPFSDGRGIHPLNVMNTWIAGLMSDVIFPTGLHDKIGVGNIRSIGGSDVVADANTLPSGYKKGITISRAVSNFPYNGAAVTIHTNDNIVIQINTPFTAAETGLMVLRTGRAITLGADPEGWNSWIYIGTRAAFVAAGTGFSGATAVTTKNGVIVNVDGYLAQNVPAIVPALTTVGTVAAGYRPTIDSFYGQATVWNGSDFETIRVRVNQTGEIVTLTATTINVNRIWFCFSYSTIVL